MGLIKILMITINVIFWAIGATMLGIGIWLAVDPNAFDSINIASSAGMDDDLWAAAVYTMIGVGAGIFLVAFLGCWGAMKEKSSFILWLYIGFVVLILLAEGVCITLIAIFWTSIDDDVRNQMTVDVQTKYINETSEDGITTSWNNMQTRWDCCGSNNYSDYSDSQYNEWTNQPVPWTCCTNAQDGGDKPSDDVIAACREEAKIHKPSVHLNPRGCYYSLVEFLDENAAIIIGVTCGFIGLQIIGVAFACCLVFRNDDD